MILWDEESLIVCHEFPEVLEVPLVLDLRRRFILRRLVTANLLIQVVSSLLPFSSPEVHESAD